MMIKKLLLLPPHPIPQSDKVDPLLLCPERAMCNVFPITDFVPLNFCLKTGEQILSRGSLSCVLFSELLSWCSKLSLFHFIKYMKANTNKMEGRLSMKASALYAKGPGYNSLLSIMV